MSTLGTGASLDTSAGPRGGTAQPGARLPRSQRRAQLLAAAQAVFTANGYHAASMDEIAERAGVSKPVLYQHFPGKLELYLALLDTQTEALAGVVRAALESPLEPANDNRARVHAVLNAFFEFVGRARGEDGGGAFRLIFETDLGNEPAVKARVDGVLSATAQAVARTVAADTGLDAMRAELLGTALTGAAQVAARWWLANDQALPQAEAVQVLETLMWRGISNFPLHA